MKKLFAITSFLFIFSCGFQPIYQANNSSSQISNKEDLASIKISQKRSRTNQELANNLDNLLNPKSIKIEPKYLLIITLRKTVSPTFITSTGSSGRNKVTLVANYKLKNIDSGAIISSGRSKAKDDFNVIQDNRFANYIAEEEIVSNLTLLIAQDMRNLLINDVSSFNAKPNL
jgi:hypothetical protein